MCSKQIQLARRIWWRSVGVGLFFLPAVLLLLNATPGHAAPRRATDATPTPTPISTDTQCNIQNVGYTFRPNTMLTIRMDTVYNGGNGLTDSGMSYTVKFTGPITLQDPPATTDSNQRVTVAAPSQTGIYHMTCTFNGATTGSGQYAPSTSGVTNVTISQQHTVGGVHLYTNPTTYNPNQSAQMYVVFQAAGGGPTPTGVFNITVGQGVSTGLIAINSQGTALVRLAPTGSAGIGNSIVINYHGDPYYKDSNPSFPIINQPIPGSTPSGSNGGSGGGGGNGSNAKTTPTAVLTTTVGATPTTAATVDTGTALTTTNDTGGGGGVPLWVVVGVVVFLLLMVGTVMGAVLVVRRRQTARAVAAAMPSANAYPQYPVSPTRQPYPPSRAFPTRPRGPTGQGESDDGDAPTLPWR